MARNLAGQPFPGWARPAQRTKILETCQAALAATSAMKKSLAIGLQGHLPDLSDCPPAKLARSRNADAEIGKMGPMGRLLIRGEYGHDFIDELTPAAGEIVIDKPGFSAFHSTALDTILRNRQVSHLILTGVTTDVCVHSTLRGAVDRGFYCLTIEDATASFEEAIQTACIDMIAVEGGIFGQVATTEAVLAA